MIRITPQHIEILAELIHDYSGILLTRLCSRSLDEKLSKHAEELGFKSMDEYLQLISSPIGMSARDELLSRITVSESFFFRNPSQFRYLAYTLLPKLVLEKKKFGLDTIRIWSAACATGEEAYSIAYIVDWFCKTNRDVKIEIVATDINHRLIETANIAAYRSRSFRKQSFEIIKEFALPLPLSKDESALFRVPDSIRALVRFQRRNLKDIEGLKSHAGSDIIMCRNVLIYFDEAFRQNLIEMFYKLLNPCGFLFLGETESLASVQGLFNLKICDGAYGYEKITARA